MGEPAKSNGENIPTYDRIEVPEISVQDMFDDVFTAIARDGAGMVEVSVRLEKALQSIASFGDEKMREASKYHGRLALRRAEIALSMAEELTIVRDAARFTV